jgi:hypothetical protein
MLPAPSLSVLRDFPDAETRSEMRFRTQCSSGDGLPAYSSTSRVASRWWWKGGGRGSKWACYAAVVTGSGSAWSVGGSGRSRRRSWSSRVAAGV